MPEGTPAEPYVRPTTTDQLLGVWSARDVEYARRSKPLTDIEVEAARDGRMREVNFLPREERARAWGIAKEWYPPEHMQ